MLAGRELNRPDRDTGSLEIDQELSQAVAAVVRSRGRGAKQADHVIGVMGTAGPDLAPIDAPAIACALGPGLGGEQVRARIRLAHADAKRAVAGDDAGQNVLFDVLGGVAEQDRPALPIGDEMAPRVVSLQTSPNHQHRCLHPWHSHGLQQ